MQLTSESKREAISAILSLGNNNKLKFGGNMKTVNLIISLMLLACAAFADTGEVQVSSKVEWKLVGNQVWSSVLEGLYENVDHDPNYPFNNYVVNSQATEACRQLNADLPSYEDFIELGDDWQKLDGMIGHYFWTTNFYLFGKYIIGVPMGISNGKIASSTAPFNHKKSVRCICRTKRCLPPGIFGE